MSMESMPAVVVRETGPKGDWNELVIENVTRPVPNSGEVLVQIEACSVNRADLLQRRGLYPPPQGASDIPGLDFAGFIAATAPDVENRHIGDRVFGILPGGGYARYAALPSDNLVSIPSNLSFIEAAATAEVFFTAYLNLFLEGGLEAGETVLIHGGGSGVGTAAIQLAKEAGATVIITAGSADKVKGCLELGATYGIDYKKEDFVSRIRELTGGEGVDLVLDSIGAPYLSKHIDLLKTRGRLVLIGLMGGTKSEINLAPLLTKRLKIIGSVLRSRSREEKARLAQAFEEHVLPMLKSGAVRPIIDRTYPIEEVEAAHLYLKEGRHFGKIVLTWHGVDRLSGNPGTGKGTETNDPESARTEK